MTDISVKTIVFSKDRPLQLQAMLRSLYEMGRNVGHVNVIVKGDHDVYEQVAKEINSSHRANVQMLYEDSYVTGEARTADTRFARMVKAQLSGGAYSHVCFCTDDTLFLQPFDMHEGAKLLRERSDVVGFSLRLGDNTTRCYMAKGAKQKMSDRSDFKKFSVWDWTKSSHDYGYPLELSSSIYSIPVAYQTLSNCAKFAMPNDMEQRMDEFKGAFKESRPMLASYHTSVAASLPMNLTQTMWKNTSGKDPAYTASYLMEQYRAGHRMVPLGEVVAPSAHTEIKFTTEKTGTEVPKKSKK